MILALPILVIPFVTMPFWALGGGQGNGNKNLAENKQGLHLQLPDANLKMIKMQTNCLFIMKQM